MSSGSLLWLVMVKEWTEILRDGRLRVLGGLIVLLGLSALAFGVAQTLMAQNERERAVERSQAQWRGQGKKNPHVAAHYGTYVFKPVTLTSAIDPGVNAQLGRSIKMVAHKQNIADHAQSSMSGSLPLMGTFTVSMVLQKLVPLLIIALGYGVWSREREHGTLRQVLSTGVSPDILFWGKFLALGVVVLGLLIAVFVGVVSVLFAIGGGEADFKRLGLLLFGYGLYYGVFCGVSVAISARASTSQGALMTALAFWGVTCLLIPRLAVAISTVVEPLPSRATLSRNIERSLEKGIDGATDREASVELLIKDILANEGFSNAGFMVDPTVLRAAELRAEAQWEDMVYNYHIEAFNDAIDRQEALFSRFGVFSPFLTVSVLSSALCATDFAHHRDFSEKAEAWRKSFVSMLNGEFARNSGEEGWSYKADKALWAKAPPFIYQQPSSVFALQARTVDALGLVCWFFAACFMARLSIRKMRVS